MKTQAFPLGTGVNVRQRGLSKREYFVAHILHGLVSQPAWYEHEATGHENIVCLAIDVADEALKQLGGKDANP